MYNELIMESFLVAEMGVLALLRLSKMRYSLLVLPTKKMLLS